MPKPDPALLDPARYPFASAIPTRFGDLDPNGHVNNVALAAALEDARVRFHYAAGFLSAKDGLSSMVVSLAIEYLGQAFYPQDLEVRVGSADIGRTSYALCQLATQDDRIVAYARTTFACVDNDRPAPIPAAFQETLRPYMLRP